VLAGAAGSVALMLHAGRRQQSRVLVLLFAIWVVSPFIAAVIANSVSKRWPVGTRAALYVLMVVLTRGAICLLPEVKMRGNPERVAMIERLPGADVRPPRLEI
jgi:hypothetical protein